MSGIMLGVVGNSYGALPINTATPSVSGTARVGYTLSSSTGTWTGAPAPTFTYQWQRGSSNLGGATSSNYVAVSADIGNTLRCVITATNSLGAVSATSANTAAVVSPPINTSAPSISGTTKVGSTLYASTGGWTGTATISYTYQWRNNGSNINGATSTSYALQGTDEGDVISVRVTASNSYGSLASTSGNTGTIQPNTGQQQYTSSGSYSWVCPAGVTSISVVAIGGGGNSKYLTFSGGDAFAGGGGGALSYKNNIAVSAGSSYTVTVGIRGTSHSNSSAGGESSFTSVCVAGGGQLGAKYSGGAGGTLGAGDGGGAGGQAGACGSDGSSSGGGGAGGYSGAGGSGGTGNSWTNNAGAASSGGGGGGGAGRNSYQNGGGGGGTGIMGAGSSGTGGAVNGSSNLGYQGGGGSGGSGGGAVRHGGNYGGGTGGWTNQATTNAGIGALRILWPGNTRSFPSTNTGNM